MMHPGFDELVRTAELDRIESHLQKASLPAVGITLKPTTETLGLAVSKLGGAPDLPPDFAWPSSRNRPLDFVIQINLAEVQLHATHDLLPPTGLLTFFYDLDKQPWGFDPDDQDGFRVIYTPAATPLAPLDIPNDDYAILECLAGFQPSQTLPHFGSRAAESLFAIAELSDDEADSYSELTSEFEALFSAPENSGHHRLLGHAANIQGDMQLEAQLVTNGLYCGNSTGYDDARRQTLEDGAGDWILLLQLDTDQAAEIMWGDCGMLYFWIRKDDLMNQRFENAWMTVQCY